MTSTAQITFTLSVNCHRNISALFDAGSTRSRSLPPAELPRSAEGTTLAEAMYQ
jgi:hypothetical protein